MLIETEFIECLLRTMKKDHLPVLGVGPAYVIAITVLTVVCITLSKLGILPYLRIRATVGVMHAVGTAF